MYTGCPLVRFIPVNFSLGPLKDNVNKHLEWFRKQPLRLWICACECYGSILERAMKGHCFAQFQFDVERAEYTEFRKKKPGSDICVCRDNLCCSLLLGLCFGLICRENYESTPIFSWITKMHFFQNYQSTLRLQHKKVRCHELTKVRVVKRHNR